MSERLSIEGLRFRLPAGWVPERMEKLKDGLSIEIHDAEGAPRMLVKMSPIAGNLDSQRALKNLEKRLKVSLDTRPAVSGFRSRLRRFEAPVAFTYRDKDGTGYGFIAARKHRQEAILAVVLAGTDAETAVSALTSVAEQPYEEDQHWEVQSLAIGLPSAYHFASYRYDRRGYMRLVLADARREVALERISGAQALLAQMGSLSAAWVRFAQKDIGRYDLVKTREFEKPHPGLYYRRDTTGILKRLKAGIRARVPLGGAYFLEGFLWHCRESNRIVGARCAARTPEDAAFAAELFQRVLCCRATGLRPAGTPDRSK